MTWEVRHITFSRHAPPHVTRRRVPQVTSLSCHVTSPMLRHVPTSRPFRHGLPTSRQVPQATLRPPRNVTPFKLHHAPHATSHPSGHVPGVTSPTSHHVFRVLTSRPSHITSRPTPRPHITFPTSPSPHVTSLPMSRTVPYVTSLLHVTSCPPSRHVPQDYTPLLDIPLTRTPPIPPVFPVRA